MTKDYNEVNEIQTQAKSAFNAEKGYRRTKEKASRESSEKAKEIDITTCAVHPLFGQEYCARQDLLDQMKTAKPKMTIFEIKQKKQKPNDQIKNAAAVMRNLKDKNDHIIQKYKGIVLDFE